MEQAPSSGKTTALAGIGATQLITVLLYVVHLYGVDMPPEVAGAIVAIAIGIAGGIMHLFQRREEKKEAINEANNPVIGGPAVGAQP